MDKITLKYYYHSNQEATFTSRTMITFLIRTKQLNIILGIKKMHNNHCY